MNRTTNDLNYRDVCQQIQSERPDGFYVQSITVNIDLLGYDIQSNVLDRICDRLKDTASYYLNDDVTIIRDNSLDELWTYSIRHSCGRTPMYDEQNDEYYCVKCEREKTVFDY